MDVRWGLEDPESGGEAQTLGREGIFLCFHHPQKQKTQIKQKKGFKVLVLYYHASSKGRPSLEGAHGGGAEKKPGSAGDSGSPSGQRAVVRKGTGWFLC